MSPRAISIAITVALHAAVVAALLQFEAVRKPLTQVVPLMVNLITPPKPEPPPPPPPPPKIEPPKPQPVVRKPQPVQPVQKAEPPPLLVTESTAPALPSAPPPKPDPGPAVAATAPGPARGPGTAPLAVVPPSFDAAYLQNPPPAYPPMSRRRGEQGKVMLRVYVNAAGAAERVEVRASSGHERLDQAAQEVVQRWRFVPARQGGQPVPAWVLVPITFSLEG